MTQQAQAVVQAQQKTAEASSVKGSMLQRHRQSRGVCCSVPL